MKTTASELIKKPQRKEVVAAVQSFLLGIAQGSSRWLPPSRAAHAVSVNVKDSEPVCLADAVIRVSSIVSQFVHLPAMLL
jgi:hypothetical protein